MILLPPAFTVVCVPLPNLRQRSNFGCPSLAEAARPADLKRLEPGNDAPTQDLPDRHLGAIQVREAHPVSAEVRIL